MNRNQSTSHTRSSRLHYLSSNSFGSSQGMLQLDIYKDYYKVLGIQSNASKQEIKKSYLIAAKKWHPDLHRTKNAKQTAETKFIEAQEAYEVLYDDSKRFEYDDQRRIRLQSQRQGTTRMTQSVHKQGTRGTTFYDPQKDGAKYQNKYSKEEFFTFGGTGSFTEQSSWRAHWQEMRDQEEEEMRRVEMEWERIRRQERFSKQFEMKGWYDQVVDGNSDPFDDPRDFMDNIYMKVARTIFIFTAAIYVSYSTIGNTSYYHPRKNRQWPMAG